MRLAWKYFVCSLLFSMFGFWAFVNLPTEFIVGTISSKQKTKKPSKKQNKEREREETPYKQTKTPLKKNRRWIWKANAIDLLMAFRIGHKVSRHVNACETVMHENDGKKKECKPNENSKIEQKQRRKINYCIAIKMLQPMNSATVSNRQRMLFYLIVTFSICSPPLFSTLFSVFFFLFSLNLIFIILCCLSAAVWILTFSK